MRNLILQKRLQAYGTFVQWKLDYETFCKTLADTLHDKKAGFQLCPDAKYTFFFRLLFFVLFKKVNCSHKASNIGIPQHLTYKCWNGTIWSRSDTISFFFFRFFLVKAVNVTLTAKNHSKLVTGDPSRIPKRKRVYT